MNASIKQQMSKGYAKQVAEVDFVAGLCNICVENVDPSDHPDYCDAYVASADREDGTPLTEDELEKLNDNFPEIAQENAFESLL